MIEPSRSQSHMAFVLFIYIEFLLVLVVASQIPLGSRISVMENNSWSSSSGDFALGFFNYPDQPNMYSVGIRFSSSSIPASQQNVVWVAGADVMVGNMSYFRLKQNGELVLFDSFKGFVVWSSRTTQFFVASAVLANNGNLVLLNDKRFVVWQSFDTPSDTLLPGQTFPAYKTLRAASKNSVSSYYSLYMNSSGQLQLRWESNVIYWTSGNAPRSNSSALLSSTGVLHLLDPYMVPVWSAFADDHGDPISFRFLRLDVDGNLRLYSWIEATNSWKSVWQAVENQCNVFATCGDHGICAFNASGSPTCICPFDSTFKPKMKCLISSPKTCETASVMLEHKHTYLHGIYPPNDTVNRTSLQQCKSQCLSNPLCTAVTFINDGSGKCLMKETEYVSGYSSPSLLDISFVKNCLDPSAVPLPKLSSPKSSLRDSKGVCITCLVRVSTGALAAFVAIQFGAAFYIFRRRLSARKKAAITYKDPSSNSLIIISYAEINDITEKFKQEIGPSIFKGVLQNKQLVMVKNMELAVEERKFRAAAMKMGSIHHKNLLKLNGYCCEQDHRFLVYEYAKKGSLRRCLEDSKLRKELTWSRRLEICSSIARALCYLHTECREFICHGNLSCENVVLDEYFEAKVTEFGLGMLQDEVSCNKSSAEKDVKDFGKLVLTLISGCHNLEDLTEWAFSEWIYGRSDAVVDKGIENGVDSDELERALRIAFWCLQSDNRVRPPMGEVVKVIEGTLNVDPPPPLFSCRRALEEEESIESSPEP